MSVLNDNNVIALMKAPMMPRAKAIPLPANLSLAQAIEELRKMPRKTVDDSRVVQQIEREMSGVHHFLVVREHGALVQVDPSKTTLGQFAVPREVQTEHGIEIRRMVAFEVQAYAPVGA